MRIAQISDVHFTRLSGRLFSKRLIGILNWFCLRRSEIDHQPLNSLPDLWRKLGIELILVAGDLTSTSLPSEFQTAKEFFDQFQEPKLFIPGNHDHYTARAHRQKRFYQFFSNPRSTVQHPAEFFSLCNHGVEAHQMGSWGWCVALDTAIPTPMTSSRGLFSSQVQNHLEEVLKLLGQEKPILLLNHFPFFQHDSPNHRLLRGDELRALLERHPNVRLYLHGHTHRHTIADLQSNHLPLILDSGCPVQISQATWNLIDLEEQGCTVSAYSWKKDGWKVFREHSSRWDLS